MGFFLFRWATSSTIMTPLWKSQEWWQCFWTGKTWVKFLLQSSSRTKTERFSATVTFSSQILALTSAPPALQGRWGKASLTEHMPFITEKRFIFLQETPALKTKSVHQLFYKRLQTRLVKSKPLPVPTEKGGTPPKRQLFQKFALPAQFRG